MLGELLANMDENPLTEEQVKKLREIAQLSPEEQKQVLPDFLSQLTPEQLKFLEEQQGMQFQQCVFCNIASGKIAAKKIYEDEHVLAVLDINPANYGHVLLLTKKHYQSFSQVPENELGYFMKIAGLLLCSISRAVNSEGGNLFLVDGLVAGQKAPHVLIHIIPRFKNDGINFNWNTKKLSEAELEEVARLLSDKTRDLLKGEVKIKEPVVEEIEFEEEERVP